MILKKNHIKIQNQLEKKKLHELRYQVLGISK